MDDLIVIRVYYSSSSPLSRQKVSKIISFYHPKSKLVKFGIQLNSVHFIDLINKTPQSTLNAVKILLTRVM